MTRTDANSSSVVFDRAAEYYDRTRGYPQGVVDHVAALLAQAGRLAPNSRILEVGVGTGRIALALAAHAGCVVGIDRSPAMLAKLRDKRVAEPVLSVLGDALALPFETGCFDAAVAVHFFHLIPQWRAALLEIKRVLAPGGCLLRGEDGQLLPELWSAVYAQLPKLDNVGVSAQLLDFPLQAGFRLAGEPLEYRYPQRVSLATFMRELEERVWSSTWRLTDAQHADLLAAMRVAIVERFGSVDAVVEVERCFTVRVYVAD